MPPNYQNGKIYTIRCHSNDKLIYVGCTTVALAKRFANHKTDKSISLYKYINNPENNTTWDDWYIELFEELKADNKEQLNKRESEVIREMATINKYGYYIDMKEWRKDYTAANREEINRKMREWCSSNRDMINQKQREYNIANRETINQKKKEYNPIHSEMINQRRKE